MARRVFFSFYFIQDGWRASQVRNIGKLEAENPVSDNEWEQVKQGGDAAIKKWIDNQMSGKSCCVVLVGSETSSRKWVRYEIEQSWNSNKAVVGIRIHRLKDRLGNTSLAGPNPFDNFTMTGGNTKLSSLVTLYDPVGADSKAVYDDISNRIEDLVEAAIKSRAG